MSGQVPNAIFDNDEDITVFCGNADVRVIILQTANSDCSHPLRSGHSRGILVNTSLSKKTAQALLDDMNKKVHSDQDILSRYTFIYRGDTDTLPLLSEEAAEHYRTLPCP